MRYATTYDKIDHVLDKIKDTAKFEQNGHLLSIVNDLQEIRDELPEETSVLYSDSEIKNLLIEEYPYNESFIEKHFDDIKQQMKNHNYFIDKTKDMITDVGLEIISDIKNGDGN